MSLYASERGPSRVYYDEAEEPEVSGWWPWAWMGVACALIAAAGLVRVWQDRRFAAVQVRSVAPNFPLKELPSRFAVKHPRSGLVSVWRAVPGGEGALDPQVSQIAGSADSLVRNYVNEETGVTVTLLVLYGQADRVSSHTPEVCYPAIGFEPVEDPSDRTYELGDAPAVFRTAAFARKGNGLDRVEVFYAFRQGGRWSAQTDGNWKSLTADPSLFKVQVQRRLAEQERRLFDNPTEMFLSGLIPELEKRISGAAAPAAPARKE